MRSSITILALLFVAGCESYNVHRFSSDDAVILYCGFWSTPRYRIPFHEMVVTDTSATVDYQFSYPPDNVPLVVGLNFYGLDDLKSLLNAEARATAMIIDASGQTVSEFHGPLTDDIIPKENTWRRDSMVAMLPPTGERFRDLGQVLTRNQIAKDGLPTDVSWGWNRQGRVLSPWRMWFELERGTYTLRITIETTEPPSKPVRVLPLIFGGSRGVL